MVQRLQYILTFSKRLELTRSQLRGGGVTLMADTPTTTTSTQKKKKKKKKNKKDINKNASRAKCQRLDSLKKNVWPLPNKRDMGVIWIAPGTPSNTTKDWPSGGGGLVMLFKGQGSMSWWMSQWPSLIESPMIVIIRDGLHSRRYLPCKSAPATLQSNSIHSHTTLPTSNPPPPPLKAPPPLGHTSHQYFQVFYRSEALILL